MMGESIQGAELPRLHGVKHDTGKPRMGLVLEDFPRAMMEVARVTTFGADKYTPSGWVTVPDGVDRYRDALARHVVTGYSEGRDKESGLLHAAHTAWNALAVLELMLRDLEDTPF